MQVQVAALCDYATDYNGKLCMVGAFDTIGVAQLPAQHANCFIALRMIFQDGDEGRHQMKMALIDEDGKSLLPGKIEPVLDVRMPQNSFFATVNLVFNLQLMKFEKAGQYSIDITLDDKMIARIPLQVILMKPQQGQPPQAGV